MVSRRCGARISQIWLMLMQHLYTQLHSELVRTTIMKDFVEFYGVSK